MVTVFLVMILNYGSKKYIPMPLKDCATVSLFGTIFVLILHFFVIHLKMFNEVRNR